MRENEIASQILDAAFIVHTKLGPGLLESVYEVVMQYELILCELCGRCAKAMRQVEKRRTQRAIGNPTRSGWPIGPVM